MHQGTEEVVRATLPGMKSGKCPKCNQRNVYASKDGAVMTESGQRYAQVNPQAATMFVCDDCRYTESYLDEKPWPKPLCFEPVPVVDSALI